MIYFDSDMSKSTNTVAYLIGRRNLYLRLQKMSHTIYVTRKKTAPSVGIIRVTIMLPMEKSVTFTGACANEIISNG